MKKIKGIVILSVILLIGAGASFSYALNDIEGHWGQSYIKWATDEMGIIKEYEGGAFRPDQAMTRGDYIIGLNHLLHQSKVYEKVDFILYNDTIPYQDIDRQSELYYSLHELNIYIKYYSNTELSLEDIFKGAQLQPQRAINRYEAALLARAVTTPPIEMKNLRFHDVATSLPYYQELMELVSNGIIQGYGDQTFRPHRQVTRAEAAVILSRVNKDFQYLLEDLAFKPITFNNFGKQQPTFTLAKGSQKADRQNQQFIKAISSLEYMSFIGYIPHNEAHLYDSNPIETLWQLKNEDYDNVVGNNYYLIVYDKNTGNIRKIELIQEAMQHLLARKNETVEGLDLFLKEAAKLIPGQEVLKFASELNRSTTNKDTKLVTGVFTAEESIKNRNIQQAREAYRQLLSMDISEKIKQQLIRNYSYLLQQYSGTASAINELKELNSEFNKDSSYKNSETQQLITGLLKKLLAEKQ